MENYPRLLVLSNDSFSKSNSNGRTLGSLLQGWPKDRIAQFCISSDGADFDVCDNYYCVTDADVLRATLHMKAACRRDLKDAPRIDSNRADGHVKHRKTSFNMLVRNTLWNLGLWSSKEFNRWISDFAPDIILIQSGDSYFMHQLAMRLAKRTSATLATFNTEGYYFFHHDYFKEDGKMGRIVFRLYHWIYKSIFRKYMKRSLLEIYGNSRLKADYDEVFYSRNSIVSYTASSLEFNPAYELNTPPTFTYLGNLGLKRPEALVEFAEVLADINPKCKIDVYGNANQTAIELFDSCKAIDYHGMVSYDAVREIINRTDVLIHVEKNDKVMNRELCYAFSTKIADCICSGRNFIMYAPAHLACSQYVVETGAAWHARNKEELYHTLHTLLYDKASRIEKLQKAKATARANHSAASTANKCQAALCALTH